MKILFNGYFYKNEKLKVEDAVEEFSKKFNISKNFHFTIHSLNENESKKMNKKTIPARIGFRYAKFYQYFLIIASILLIFTFATKFKISNNLIFIIVGILPITFHLFKVNQAKSPTEFKPLLKQLAISTFFFSIFMSIFLIYESLFF